MTLMARARSRLDVRSWPIATAPRRLLPVLALVAVVPAVWLITLYVQSPPSVKSVLLVAFLGGLAMLFEEIVTRVSRLQLRLSADLKRDMTSVWAVAGAVALAPSAAALLLGIVLVYTWFRHQKPAGEALFRKVFNSANNLTSCLTASVAAHSTETSLHYLPGALAGSLAACAALVTFAAVNRVIASVALVTLGARLRDLFGTREDNLIEFATLCLGGLVAVAILHQPLLAVLVIAPMVTLQRGAVMRELETAATTDAKTGLLNAVAWEQVASRELTRAAREGNDLTVLIIDIDHFKRVNDRFGHLVGDSALRVIGRTLQAEVREYDTVARFGGEEFVAVLPSASSAEAEVIAERLRAKVNEIRMSAVVDGLGAEGDERLAVSIGVATAPMDGVELPDLLHAADGALYRAKDFGRNRVELADSGRGDHLQTLPFA